MTLRLSSVPETYDGPLGEPVVGVFMGVSALDRHPGLFALHFLTKHGPLPLFAYGDVTESDGATFLSLRSDKLAALGLDAEDFGDDFKLVAGRKTGKDGKPGKASVVELERAVNRAEELVQFLEEVSQAEAALEAPAIVTGPYVAPAPVNGTASSSNGSVVVEVAGDTIPAGGFDQAEAPPSDNSTAAPTDAKVPRAASKSGRKGRPDTPP